MKKLLITTILILLCNVCYAQCVATILDVYQREDGRIHVETEYEMNGEVVQIGGSIYSDDTGTNEEIIVKAKEDVDIHCKNLIKRLTVNKEFINTEKLKQKTAVIAPIVASIEKDLEGHINQVDEVTTPYKGKDIKVTYDSQNIVTDSIK